MRHGWRIEAAEDHPLEPRVPRQEAPDFSGRDPRRAINGKSVNARGNCWKCKAEHLVLDREAERIPVAGRKELILAGAAALPDRPHRMDDVLRPQAVSAGDPGFAGGTAAERPAFLQKVPTRRAVDGTVDAATAEKACVRRVHDRVNRERRDVAQMESEARILARGFGGHG